MDMIGNFVYGAVYGVEASYISLKHITDSQGTIGRKILLDSGYLLLWYFLPLLGSYQLIVGVTALSNGFVILCCLFTPGHHTMYKEVNQQS